MANKVHVQNSLAAGNVIRNEWPGDFSNHINLYLGNGRCGACFDAYGLMHNGLRENRQSISNTTVMHADHWHRGAYGLDYWLPLARLVWAIDPPAPPTSYNQELDLYDARLTTRMAWSGLVVSLVAWFHPEQRDMWAVEIAYSATADTNMPDLLIVPETDLQVHYKQHVTGVANTLEHNCGWWLCQVLVGSADSLLLTRVFSSQGQCCLVPLPKGMGIRFAGERGQHLLLFGAAATTRREELCQAAADVEDPKMLSAQARHGWHKRWGCSAIQVPDKAYQALWARSAYYVLASYAPDVRAPAPPNGWSGNGWPFHFPQDLSFIHPALLRLGHLDIARSWVEYYRMCLDETRRFTTKIFGKTGTMWPWVFPMSPNGDLLEDGAPNWCHYEIHNMAYPARMAREAALYLRDRLWAEEVAWPVVRESARFAYAVLTQTEDGTYGIHVIPSMGQDERGGRNASNYLCALFSARYALSTACAMAVELGITSPEVTAWRSVLERGLAFSRLYDAAKRYYLTVEGFKGSDQLGKQKHPVQLNPIIFLPTGPLDEATAVAYRQRHQLCVGVAERRYAGWTLAAYWLAASHMKEPAALLYELAQSVAADYVDAGWLQIYESSHAHHMPFYVTSHGLYLQALQDALVSDYWGNTEIGAACPDEWQEVSFTSLFTADGHVLSGQKAGDTWRVDL